MILHVQLIVWEGAREVDAAEMEFVFVANNKRNIKLYELYTLSNIYWIEYTTILSFCCFSTWPDLKYSHSA